MEANELFIFKRSLLSLRTHGCNKLFIPPRRREAITLEGERERREEWGRERGGIETVVEGGWSVGGREAERRAPPCAQMSCGG